MSQTAPLPAAPLFNVGRWAIAQVAARTGITEADILGRSRFREHFRARRMVCLELHARGWSYSRIGRLLGRDHTTISHAVRSARG
jgi:chromosomal replication initiation ATPase DnaA